jgi:hypothetical protein
LGYEIAPAPTIRKEGPSIGALSRFGRTRGEAKMSIREDLNNIRLELGEYALHEEPVDAAVLRELAAELLAIADKVIAGPSEEPAD